MLKRWIRQGAGWGTHWSYEPVVRPAIPTTEEVNPIDAYLSNRLQREGLTFSPEADRGTLIRRLALDITGLPPTMSELASLSRVPHERIVDYYLGRPSYGEHWARSWLDLARYADSAGYPSDPAERSGAIAIG